VPWGRDYGYPARPCDECGQSFYPKLGFENFCFPCWKKARDAKEQPTVLPHPSEWASNLPKLIQLCHPDKHAGSQLSNRVTNWLLEQRARLRQ
jgi:hypothetical protein